MEVRKESYNDLELYPIHKQQNRHNIMNKKNYRTIVRVFEHRYSINNTLLAVYKIIGAILGIGVVIAGSYMGYCAFWCR